MSKLYYNSRESATMGIRREVVAGTQVRKTISSTSVSLDDLDIEVVVGADWLDIHVESGEVRISMDGTDASATNGFLYVAGLERPELMHVRGAGKLRFIRTGGTDAVINLVQSASF